MDRGPRGARVRRRARRRRRTASCASGPRTSSTRGGSRSTASASRRRWRRCSSCPCERVLVTHGEPVVTGGAEALRAALDAPALVPPRLSVRHPRDQQLEARSHRERSVPGRIARYSHQAVATGGQRPHETTQEARHARAGRRRQRNGSARGRRPHAERADAVPGGRGHALAGDAPSDAHTFRREADRRRSLSVTDTLAAALLPLARRKRGGLMRRRVMTGAVRSAARPAASAEALRAERAAERPAAPADRRR